MLRAVPFVLVLLCLPLNGLFADEREIRLFVDTYCIDCHSGEDAERGFNLDELSFDLNDTATHARWVRAYDKVARHEMPPQEYDQPEKSKVDAYLNTLRPELVKAEKLRYAIEGRSTMRRLSRDEHIHALRDLLMMPLLDSGDKLPPDPLSDGFGKSSSALPFSHVQVDRYLEVADDSLRAAMAPQREKPESRKTSVWIKDLQGETITLDRGNPREQETLRLIRESNSLYLEFKHGSGIPLIGCQRDTSFESHPGNFQTKKHGYVLDQKPYIDAIGIVSNAPMKIGRASAAGRYTIRLDAFAFQANQGTVASTERTEVVAIYGEKELLGTFDVADDSRLQQQTVYLRAGEEVSIALATLPLWRIEVGDKTQRYLSVDVPAIAIKGYEFEGPVVDMWPPASHRRLFGDLPLRPNPNSDGKSGLDYQVISDAPHKDARLLLASFMEEAYRRDISPRDFSVPMGLFEKRLEGGASFQDAMIAAYGAVLSSPSFTLVPMKTGSLSSDELANRLSLFLWNAPADKSLRQSLTEEVLDNDERYRAFVEQMLSDPRSNRFVEHFLDHWLNLRDIGVTEPDENLYSGYSTWTLESMLLETRAYFKEMLRLDLPARNVIDSEFLMINGELAELYGIDGPTGANIKRIAIGADSARGGLLTQASVMKVSANGTTTSPVVRGVYVMDRLLGDPPPPPPEAVAAVEPDLSGATTIRDQLARHREDPSCATCHRKIDPPGFALESFDVMGRYRERYHSLEQGEPVEGINRRAQPIKYRLGLSVDCSGQLDDGSQFADINEFRQLVLTKERLIARNLLERFVVYATGHPAGISDREHVEAILDGTAENGYGVRSMILELVQSPLFRNK
ncbi:DUF1588 domain-containing protein [Bremerella sp.]|uniref:DUF1588 domain-containing protein n=1 Tax=Bremerella sp. TaxID=2795602 RepID=UPI00391D0DFD